MHSVTHTERVCLTYVSLAVALIPIAINGSSSHFKSGQSSQAQRVWTMMWLAFGSSLGVDIVTSSDSLIQRLGKTFFFFAPSIGGFVVVGQIIV